MRSKDNDKGLWPRRNSSNLQRRANSSRPTRFGKTAWQRGSRHRNILGCFLPQPLPQVHASSIRPLAASFAAGDRPLPKTSMATTAWQFLTSLAGKCKAAAQLVAMQAERTKLSNVTLPGAFRASARTSTATAPSGADFADIYQSIDGLLAQIKTLQTPSVKARGLHKRRRLLPRPLTIPSKPKP